MKACKNCINGLVDHNPCFDVCLPDYSLFVEGDRLAEMKRLEHEGIINQVIGGAGEHEINAKWSITTAYEMLSTLCEYVGGAVYHNNNKLYLDRYDGSYEISFNPCTWKKITKTKEVRR